MEPIEPIFSQENHPPRNGFAWCQPQVPQPPHPPPDRPVLRAMRADGSLTPARPPHGLCTMSPPVSHRAELPHAPQLTGGAGQQVAVAPPHGSMEMVIGGGGSVHRSASVGRQQPPSRCPSPPPALRHAVAAVSAVPVQAHPFQPPSVLTTGSIGMGGRSTPRSAPPGRAVAVPASPGWHTGAHASGASTPTPQASLLTQSPRMGTRTGSPALRGGRLVHAELMGIPSAGSFGAAATLGCAVTARQGSGGPHVPVGQLVHVRHGSPLSHGLWGQLGPPPPEAPAAMVPRTNVVRTPTG